MKSPETIATGLVAAGAVLHITAPHVERYLVGELAWLDQQHIFWFTAHGDREDDGHILAFDRAIAICPHGVEFTRNDQAVAYLTAISSADIDDPEDYSVAFSIWRQTGPAMRSLIDHARDFALANADSFAAVVRDGAIHAAPAEGPSAGLVRKQTMSDADVEALLTEVRRGGVSARTATSLMALNGIDRAIAARRIFYALGGGDQMEIGADGQTRYVGTGKLVCEVERKISASSDDRFVA